MKIGPDGAAESHRQILEQSLGDEAQLDVAFIGRQLAAQGLAVTLAPVSYTHLDVYKRQRPGFLAAFQPRLHGVRGLP